MRSIILVLTIIVLASCNNSQNTPQTEGNDSSSTAFNDTTTATPPKDSYAKAAIPPDSNFLIIAGKRIGHIIIGQHGDSLTKILGKPSAQDAAMGKSWMAWYGNSGVLNILTTTDMGAEDAYPYVFEIRVTSPEFYMSDSIRTGSTMQQIRNKFSSIKQVADFNSSRKGMIKVYDSKSDGIAFEFDSKNICTAIIAHKVNEGLNTTFIGAFGEKLY